MKSAIEEIMFGRRTADSVIPTPEMHEALEKEMECEEKLLALLQDVPDGEKVYKEFRDALEIRSILEGIVYYKSAFRFGCRLGLDVLVEDCAENGKK